MSLPACVQPNALGTQLQLQVTPRSSKDRVGEPTGEELRVWTSAPPVDAAANEAVVRLLAERLNCRRGDVTLVRGHTSRRKVVVVAGLPPADVLARLQSP